MQWFAKSKDFSLPGNVWQGSVGWMSVLPSFPSSRDGILLLKNTPDATLASKRQLTTDCPQSEPSTSWAQKAEAEEEKG